MTTQSLVALSTQLETLFCNLLFDFLYIRHKKPQPCELGFFETVGSIGVPVHDNPKEQEGVPVHDNSVQSDTNTCGHKKPPTPK